MSAVLTHVCLFCDDVPELAAWYGHVLGIEPVFYGSEYAELSAGQATLAIFERRQQNELAPGSAAPGPNRNSIVEFRVQDVDAEYQRLLPLGHDWVKGPTTQWWGNRSVYLRDPEGNMVNLYTRVG